MTTTPKRRVMELVRAAGRLSDPLSPAGRAVRNALYRQGPLSPEGVELALREHLETDPAPRDLDRLIEAAGTARRVHVVLSANVFVGALRALALALAATPQVVLRMSRREDVFAKALVAAVQDREVAAPIHFTDRLEATPGDEVHLYGHDATLRDIAAGLEPDVLVRPHGSGLGVAVIGASAKSHAAIDALASDVIAFDQRGCLSPRIVVVEGNYVRSVSFARSLASALDVARVTVPIGRLEPSELAQRTRFRDTCRMVGELFQAGEGSVGVAPPLLVPPVGRNVFVLPADGTSVSFLLRPLGRTVATVGIAGTAHDAVVATVLGLFPRARVCPLGKMQKPPLDGPVDRRVPERLTPADVVRRFR